MNKNLTQKFADKMGDSFNSLKKWIAGFSEEYDIASVPAFVIFMIVITAGLTVNYFFLAPQVGSWESLAISLLFEVGIFGWKMQSHRVKNSAAQAQVVNWATWLSVGSAFAMLATSLTGWLNWGWIVAVAALIHVITYLIFDQNDEIRNNKRERRSTREAILQKNFKVESAIQEAEADLKVIEKIVMELGRLRQQYGHLPNTELEFVLEAHRQRLLKEYKASEAIRDATASAADVNGDGKVPSVPSPHVPASWEEAEENFSPGETRRQY